MGYGMKTMARYKIFNASLCSATENVVSGVIDVQHGDGNFALSMQASTSAADINWTYECSDDGTTFDTDTTLATRTIMNAHSGEYRIKGFNLPACKYVRIRATGDGTNPAGTTVWAKLMITED